LTYAGGQNESYEICYTYEYDSLFKTSFGYAVSVIVVVINTILKMAMITLIKFIGEDTHSAQLKSITNGVFVTQYFNTAFLVVLSYANFSEVGLPL
jgi:hypothetical protein